MKKGLQDEEEEFEQYKIGNIVEHDIFGKGTILGDGSINQSYRPKNLIFLLSVFVHLKMVIEYQYH